MYDRVALAADEPWGLVCRDNESKQMQGFCMLGTFASWDKTLRWASRDPRAWGVADYDPNCGRRIRVNARQTSDDEFDDADLADISDPRARADEKKLRAYIAAATQAAKSAADWPWPRSATPTVCCLMRSKLLRVKSVRRTRA